VSRADGRTLPSAPRLGRVLKVAGEDLYYHGVRLVPANVVWGVGLLITASLVVRTVLGLAFVIVMIPLTFALMGMAAILVRERSLVMGDFVRPIRTHFLQRFALGVAQVGLLVVAAGDLTIGLQLGGIFGAVLTMVALYTVIGVWIYAVVAWPLVMDPAREDESLRSRLRLALILALAHPVRIGALALVLAVLVSVATVLAAAIITFAAAYAALVAAHYVLPAADRLEGREAVDADVGG
jgi:uncharacterized membrane protein YesL